MRGRGIESKENGNDGEENGVVRRIVYIKCRVGVAG